MLHLFSALALAEPTEKGIAPLFERGQLLRPARGDRPLSAVVEHEQIVGEQMVVPIHICIERRRERAQARISSPILAAAFKERKRRGGRSLHQALFAQRVYVENGVARLRITAVAALVEVKAVEYAPAPRIAQYSAPARTFHAGNGIAVLHPRVVIVGGGDASREPVLALRAHRADVIAVDHAPPVFARDSARVIIRAHRAEMIAFFYRSVVVEAHDAAHRLFAAHISVHAEAHDLTAREIAHGREIILPAHARKEDMSPAVENAAKGSRLAPQRQKFAAYVARERDGHAGKVLAARHFERQLVPFLRAAHAHFKSLGARRGRKKEKQSRARKSARGDKQ